MSDRDDDNLNSHEYCSYSSLISPFKTLFESLKIFIRNKRFFLSVFALTTFPLSLLLVSLSVSIHPLQSRVQHLESLARFSPTRFESRQIWKESRAEAISLLRIRALYALPCISLSLLAAVYAVSVAHSAFHGKRSGIAPLSIAVVWERSLRLAVTAICVYLSMWIYFTVVGTLTVAASGMPVVKFAVFVISSGVEVYLMAVLSLGLVVSIVEERLGFEAIRVGSGLIEGMRWSGWALSGWFVFVTGWIWRKLEEKMDGQDWSNLVGMVRWTVGIKFRALLIPLYAGIVLWSYVVITALYCECRRKHGIRSGERVIEMNSSLSSNSIQSM